MMLLVKFSCTRILFILLFVIVQFDLHYSQIRFPDENDKSNENNSNTYRNNSKPIDGRITNNNNNRNFNTNWNYRTNCMSYRYVPGYCVPLYLCGELRYSRDFNILRRSLCGFYGNEPKVCCPAQGALDNNGGYPNNPNAGYPNGYPNPSNPNSLNPNNGINPNNNYPNPSTPPSNNNQPNDNLNNENNANLDFTYPRSLPQPCGISLKEANRVVGGSPAIPGAWPWMVSLQYGKKGSRNHLCGATLIKSDLVITASHCVTNDDNSITGANLLGVRLGEHNIEQDSPDDAAQEFDIAQVYKHPDYKNDNTYISDIAVLRLNGHAQFNERVAPICLPYDSDLIRSKSLTGRSAMVTGWGLTSFNGQSSATLLQATLKVVNPTFCKNAFQKWAKITEDQICAASQGWDKDSCQGDSGGPLTMYEPNRKRWYLIGVVSFGRRCASKDLPGVYTRTASAKHLAWLKQFY